MTGDPHAARIRRQFGPSAAGYRSSASHARGRSLARLLALIQPGPQWRALDVATGAGHTAAALAPRVGGVIASDMTRQMLGQAAALCRERGVTNVHLVMENAQRLAYADSSFHLITCRVAAHHFAEPDRFLAEAARVLKPGGHLIVIDNIVPEDDTAAAWMNRFERRRDPSHARCLMLSEWRALYQRAGLIMEHLEVGAKRLDFDDWMRRMGVAPATARALHRELLAAPALARAFWRPRHRHGITELALREAILVGRRPP